MSSIAVSSSRAFYWLADAVTKSAVFFLAATALLVIAEVCYLMGHLARPRPSICIFIAGVILIISGKP
jgi:hypothetical protein